MKQLRALAGSAGVYLFANLVNAAIPFALMPILTRTLSEEEYGRLGVFSSAHSLFAIVVGLGSMGYVRMRYFKVNDEQMARIMGGILIIFLTTSLALGFGVAAARLAGLQPPGIDWPELTAGLASGAFQFIFTLRLTLWQMKERPAQYGFVLLLGTVANASISLFLVLIVGLGWEGRAIGVLIPLLLLGTGMMIQQAWSRSILLTGTMDLMGSMLKYGLPLMPHAAMAPILVLCERAALARGPGLDAAGTFFMAAQFATPIVIFANSSNLAFKPWSYKHMTNNQQSLVVQASYLMMLAIAVIGMLYATLLSSIVPIILGKNVPDILPCTYLLTAASVANGWYLVVSKGLFFTGNTGVLALISVPLHLITAALTFAMDSLLSMASLHLLSQCVLVVFVWLASQRRYPQPWLHPLRPT